MSKKVDGNRQGSNTPPSRERLVAIFLGDSLIPLREKFGL
jgi:hypothetical protein